MKKLLHKITIVLAVMLMLPLWSGDVLTAEASASNTKNITIGITYSSSTGNYVKAVEQAGAIAKVLPLVTTRNETRKQLAKVDALILTGGDDIDPSNYGESRSSKIGQTYPERDFSDLLMVKVAMEMDMPVLGICRGMQIMNVARGGTLYQDIPTEYVSTGETILHRGTNSGWIMHEISIKTGSMLYDIVGTSTLNVRSSHHQAIKKLGKNITVIAEAEDGIIEAIQFDDEEYMIGVQFHPEKSVVSNNGEQVEFFLTLKEKALEYRERILKEMEAPKPLSSILYEHDNVKVYWDSVEYATGYAVYYKKASSSSYSLLNRTTNTYVKTGNLTDGVKYWFKVVPYAKRGGTFYKGSEEAFTNVWTLKKMNAPTISKYSSSKVKVVWKDIYGQSGYQISRSTSSTKTNIVSTIKTTTGISKVLKNSTTGKTCYYKVRAYKTVNGIKIFGPWSNVVKYAK